MAPVIRHLQLRAGRSHVIDSPPDHLVRRPV